MDDLTAGRMVAVTGAAKKRRMRRLRSDGRHLAWVLGRMQALASHHTSIQLQATSAWGVDVDVHDPAGFEDLAIMPSETIEFSEVRPDGNVRGGDVCDVGMDIRLDEDVRDFEPDEGQSAVVADMIQMSGAVRDAPALLEAVGIAPSRSAFLGGDYVDPAILDGMERAVGMMECLHESRWNPHRGMGRHFSKGNAAKMRYGR